MLLNSFILISVSASLRSIKNEGKIISFTFFLPTILEIFKIELAKASRILCWLSYANYFNKFGIFY